MARQLLYIVHGAGTDAVGLVGSITTPIAAAGGNIVDLRQDVLHGLFTIYMVVDLTGSELRINELKEMIGEIAENTGLELAVDKYLPIARNPDKKNMLLILLGADRAGIIASISQKLGGYKINIEFATTVAREGIFLMELLTDISHCAIPLENLKTVLDKSMGGMGIKTIFQTDDVFNKKKRAILFDVASSFMSAPTLAEILRQTGLRAADITAAYPPGNVPGSLTKAASLLAGFPVDVMDSLLRGIAATPETMELLTTLRIMGYKIGLTATAFSALTDHLKAKLDIDYCAGVDLPVDHDTKTFAGEIGTDGVARRAPDAVVRLITSKEAIGRDDVTVISDTGAPETPGIRLTFDLSTLLDYYNKHVISKDALVGVLGSFGMPRV